MHIPPQNMEIEKIFSQLKAAKSRSIAISSVNSGEGVTSIAIALAQRSLLAGDKTLLVDLNLHRPAFNQLLDIEQEPSEKLLNTPRLITTQTHQIALTGITAPDKREMVMMLRRPGVLKQCIDEWLNNFDNVIFDTSPLGRLNANNIPAEQIAAACDGCLLVVLAGHTTEAMITSAVKKLKSTGSTILGCIYNDKYNPSLKNELHRELNRLEPRFSRFTRPLHNFLNKNRLLSMET